MAVSDKLAGEIYTIVIFHVIALFMLFSFSLYIYLRAKKTPVLYSYLAVVAMIILWMASKIMKTVAPTEGLRWFFIVTQYFGVDFLGFCLVVFAYIYARDRIPSKKALILWGVLPMLSFILVLTNPLHMGFYSYYDFYRDYFGPLFYPAQAIQYAYLLGGIVMLSRGFTSQQSFHGKKHFAILFAVITLMPLLGNFYYILFKANVFSWVFPFPVFDFTPIASSIALILFMIPALTFRFFDISAVSYASLLEHMPHGIVFLDKKKLLYGGNSSFYQMFGLRQESIPLLYFADQFTNRQLDKKGLLSFVTDNTGKEDMEMHLQSNKAYRIVKKRQNNGHLLISFSDITDITENRIMLTRQNAELNQIHHKLDRLAEETKELTITRTKSLMAQNVHDILGHSLTVVIGTLELAADDNREAARSKLSQVSELLHSSLSDLKNIGIVDGNYWGRTSLMKAVGHLENPNIIVDFTVHGNVYELSSPRTEAVFRLCQEAVTNAIKHSNAETIYIILRYKPNEVEVFVIDNGKGCSRIVKSHGLSGMESRFKALSGQVDFSSDGESGFTIHASLPILSGY